MKYRLSTILLIITCIAILIAWQVERHSTSNISGTWGFPDGVEQIMWTTTNYSDVLTIGSDGRFCKKQDFGHIWTTYSGVCEKGERGLVTFHINKITHRSLDGSEKSEDASFSFLCRCEVDAQGFLIVNEYLEFREFQEFDENMNDVHWRSYKRRQ